MGDHDRRCSLPRTAQSSVYTGGSSGAPLGEPAYMSGHFRSPWKRRPESTCCVCRRLSPSVFAALGRTEDAVTAVDQRSTAAGSDATVREPSPRLGRGATDAGGLGGSGRPRVVHDRLTKRSLGETGVSEPMNATRLSDKLVDASEPRVRFREGGSKKGSDDRGCAVSSRPSASTTCAALFRGGDSEFDHSVEVRGDPMIRTSCDAKGGAEGANVTVLARKSMSSFISSRSSGGGASESCVGTACIHLQCQMRYQATATANDTETAIPTARPAISELGMARWFTADAPDDHVTIAEDADAALDICVDVVRFIEAAGDE